ncbi:MAG TPA: dihydrofolate reductase family protein [Micromonosporaceae bacterium]|nr:dihydrofolate reductase family protein [Micromonosporaceae bacterium]
MATPHDQTTTGKVVVAMQTSLDGFVATPDGDLSWIWPHFDEDLKKAALAGVQQAAIHVMGRNTYLAQAATWPHSRDALAALVNRAEKVVFSSTLDHLDWENSRLATAPLAEELAQLKRRIRGNITITGGAQLAQAASRLGVVDEYHLMIHPIALGAGLPLFADLEQPLQLQPVSRQHFDTGVQRVVLQPRHAGIRA